MMRKRPPSQNGGYNNHQKRRHSHSHSQGGNGSGNRPRRNYGAAREKYLAQARDALSAGDRVMAEYFYQHADHCFRMMMEEGQFRQPRPQTTPAEGEAQQAYDTEAEQVPMDMPNTNPLPAFITGGYSADANKAPEETIAPQNWEERDA